PRRVAFDLEMRRGERRLELQARIEQHARAAVGEGERRRQLEVIGIRTDLVPLGADGLFELEEREGAGLGRIVGGRAYKNREDDDRSRGGKRADTRHRGGASFDVLPSATRLASS